MASPPPPEGLSALLAVLTYLCFRVVSTVPPMYRVANKVDIPSPYLSYPLSWWSNGQNAMLETGRIMDNAKQSEKYLIQVLRVSADIVPDSTACPYDAMGFTDEQYTYLWTTGEFCKVVTTSGIVNYEAITRVKHLAQTGANPDAINNIITGFASSITYLSATLMKTYCTQTMSYDDMTSPQLKALCGCYVNVPSTYSTSEKAYAQEHPECIPSCYDSTVRYVLGGYAQTCQQTVCIADSINVTGADVSISQVCPQCTGQFQCVCYIHVNGKTINNSTCGVVNDVDDQGNVTSVTTRTHPGAASGFANALKTFANNPGALWGTIAAVVVVLGLAITIAVVMAYRKKHAGMPKRSKRSAKVTMDSTTYPGGVSIPMVPMMNPMRV